MLLAGIVVCALAASTDVHMHQDHGITRVTQRHDPNAVSRISKGMWMLLSRGHVPHLHVFHTPAHLCVQDAD